MEVLCHSLVFSGFTEETAAVLDVTLAEVSRLGIVKLDEDGKTVFNTMESR